MSVIVPSRDSAPGSSDKHRSPPYWLYGSGEDVASLKAELEALEKAYSQEAPEPDFADTTAAQQRPQAEQQQHPELRTSSPSSSSSACAASTLRSRDTDAEAEDADLDLILLDAAQLRERIASAALASTSAPAASSVSASGSASYAFSHSRQTRSEAVAAGSGSGSAFTAAAQPRAHSGASHSASTAETTRSESLHQQAGLNGLGSHSLNGAASLNGVHLNGSSLNGVHVGVNPNGAALVNGVHLNGASLNGASVNGASLNGAAHIGAGSSSDGNGAVHAAAEATAAPAAPAASAAPAAPDQSIPGSIWILCCISAALTCASCVFNTALPIYMVSELKMSMRSMGMFEGLLEAFSYVVRMCSGVVSDRMTSRKAAITLGFAAGAAAKFGMASAGTVGLLFAGKAVDRLANGIQAAPRDALIGDLSPPGSRSACFGLAQSLRKWGSAVGALAAFFLMKASNNNYQLIFYSAAMVSLTATVAFVAFVPAHTRSVAPQTRTQPSHHTQGSTQGSTQLQQQAAAAAGQQQAAAAAASGPFAGVREFLRSVAGMGADFYRMLGVICLYALGHINESLLEARAMEVGFGKAEATLVVAALAAVTFLTAYPLGRLDDRFGAGTTFAVGISALIAGDLVLLLSGPHPMALFAACAFLGVHWAVIQGPLLSIVSGLAPGHLRGTAFGIFYTVMAVTAVAANTMYGSIWHTYGANAAFATSAGLMSLVLAALPHMLPAAARRGSAAAAAVPAPAAPAPINGDGGKGGLMAAPLPAAA